MPSSAATAVSSAAGARPASLPLASASFTYTTSPASAAAASAGSTERSCRFQVACTASKPPRSSARSTVSRWPVPLTLSPTRTPRSRRRASSSSTAASSSTPLSCVAEWMA